MNSRIELELSPQFVWKLSFLRKIPSTIFAVLFGTAFFGGLFFVVGKYFMHLNLETSYMYFVIPASIMFYLAQIQSVLFEKNRMRICIIVFIRTNFIILNILFKI